MKSKLLKCILLITLLSMISCSKESTITLNTKPPITVVLDNNGDIQSIKWHSDKWDLDQEIVFWRNQHTIRSVSTKNNGKHNGAWIGLFPSGNAECFASYDKGRASGLGFIVGGSGEYEVYDNSTDEFLTKVDP